MRPYALVFVVVFAAVALAEDVANEAYERWKSFATGSSVTIHSDVDTAGVKVEYEFTETLVEISKEKAVVETTGFTKIGANKLDLKPKKTEYRATVTRPESKGEKVTRKEDDGELEVAGKKLKCHWIETTIDNGTSKTTEKSWFSDEVPGKVVRQDTTVDGATKTTTSSVVTRFEKK